MLDGALRRGLAEKHNAICWRLGASCKACVKDTGRRVLWVSFNKHTIVEIPRRSGNKWRVPFCKRDL